MELNRYVYAIGNPINYSDPSGYFAIETGSINSKVGIRGHAAQRALHHYMVKTAREGFIGGVMGWIVGRVILNILNPSSYNLLGSYEWWIHVSNGVDMFISGVMGGFIEMGNAVMPSLLNHALRVYDNIGDVARFVVNNRFSIGYFFTAIFGSAAKFKDWVPTSITYEQAGIAGEELVRDLLNQLAIIAPAGGVINIVQWHVPEIAGRVLGKLGISGANAFAVSFINVITSGLLNTFDAWIDDRQNP